MCAHVFALAASLHACSCVCAMSLSALGCSHLCPAPRDTLSSNLGKSMAPVCGQEGALGQRAAPGRHRQVKGHKLLAPRSFGLQCCPDLLDSGHRGQRRGDGTGAGRRRNQEKRAGFGTLSFYIFLVLKVGQKNEPMWEPSAHFLPEALCSATACGPGTAARSTLEVKGSSCSDAKRPLSMAARPAWPRSKGPDTLTAGQGAFREARRKTQPRLETRD